MTISEIRRQLVGKVLVFEDEWGGIEQKRITDIFRTWDGRVAICSVNDFEWRLAPLDVEELCTKGKCRWMAIWEDMI